MPPESRTNHQIQACSHACHVRQCLHALDTIRALRVFESVAVCAGSQRVQRTRQLSQCIVLQPLVRPQPTSAQPCMYGGAEVNFAEPVLTVIECKAWSTVAEVRAMSGYCL